MTTSTLPGLSLSNGRFVCPGYYVSLVNQPDAGLYSIRYIENHKVLGARIVACSINEPASSGQLALEPEFWF